MKKVLFIILSLLLFACDSSNDDTAEIEGCTDDQSNNFNPDATVDDGTCDDVSGTDIDCLDTDIIAGIEIHNIIIENFEFIERDAGLLTPFGAPNGAPGAQGMRPSAHQGA